MSQSQIHWLMVNLAKLNLPNSIKPHEQHHNTQQPPQLHVTYSRSSCHPSELRLSCAWAQPDSKRALSFQPSNDSLNKFRVLLRKPLNPTPPSTPQHEPFSCFSSCVPLTCNHILPHCQTLKLVDHKRHWPQLTSEAIKSWKSKGPFFRRCSEPAGLTRQM